MWNCFSTSLSECILVLQGTHSMYNPNSHHQYVLGPVFILSYKASDLQPLLLTRFTCGSSIKRQMPRGPPHEINSGNKGNPELMRHFPKIPLFLFHKESFNKYLWGICYMFSTVQDVFLHNKKFTSFSTHSFIHSFKKMFWASPMCQTPSWGAET